MGKKKGGAKNKLAKMSEEERARYLQHRADVEVETRRRKQQLISLFMKVGWNFFFGGLYVSSNYMLFITIFRPVRIIYHYCYHR